MEAHTKYFPQGVVAELRYKDELTLGFDPRSTELGWIQFLKQAQPGDRGTVEREVLRLKDVPPIIFSEVVLEISELLLKSNKEL